MAVSFKKRSSRRRSRGTRKPSMIKLARRVKSLSKHVSKTPLQTKWISVPTQGISTIFRTAEPVLLCLNPIPDLATGSGQPSSCRTGDICRMQSLHMTLNVYTTLSILDDQMVRIVLCRSENTDGTLIDPGDVFNSATPQPYDVRNVLHKNYHKFHILYDKVFMMGPPQISVASVSILNTASPSERVIKIHKRLGFNTNYNLADAGTNADIDTNGLFLMMFTDSTINGGITVNGAYNLSFYDT